MRSLLVTSMLVAFAASARADSTAPPEAWQSSCVSALGRAKDEMIARELISEPQITVGDFSLPEYEGHAQMVKLEFFVSHGLAVTTYVWRLERAVKTTGWRDTTEPVRAPNGIRFDRERGRLHAQIAVGNSTPAALKIFRAILTKAADACLK